MGEHAVSAQEISNREHIAPSKTGDNIAAKRVAGYVWTGGNWARETSGLFTQPYDRIVVTYTDSTKTTVSSIVTYLNGVVQETITNEGDSVTDDLVRS